jgi:nucleoside-diphosphate-sugar epimerase
MVNVEGSMRVAEAAKEAGVPALIYSSSVGAYSPGPKDRRVDESWPTGGTPTSYYARHKAEVERRLDRFEREAPDVRVVRMRPGLVFKKEAAEGIRRLFAGPFLPSPLVRTDLINAIPDIPNLRSQIVHSYDVGEAFRLAIVNDGARGAFNLATEPVIDPQELARILDARPVPVWAQVARAGARLSWRLRLQPASEGWLDMAMSVPVMDTGRARRELGWTPERGADETLLDLLEGLRTGAGLDTPPLSPETSGPFRIREILTGVGGREP